MSASYRSNRGQVLAVLDAASAAGLVAAGALVQRELKRALAPGFKGGAFVTGHLVNSITVSAPFQVGDRFTIRVGTSALRDGVSYPLAWELGHFNTFTRQYEREERWVPTLIRVRDEAAVAFRIAAMRRIGSAGSADATGAR